MLQEDGVVGSTAQVADGNIGLRLRRGSALRAANVLLGLRSGVWPGLAALSPVVVDACRLSAWGRPW